MTCIHEQHSPSIQLWPFLHVMLFETSLQPSRQSTNRATAAEFVIGGRTATFQTRTLLLLISLAKSYRNWSEINHFLNTNNRRFYIKIHYIQRWGTYIYAEQCNLTWFYIQQLSELFRLLSSGMLLVQCGRNAQTFQRNLLPPSSWQMTWNVGKLVLDYKASHPMGHQCNSTVWMFKKTQIWKFNFSVPSCFIKISYEI
jgi:hypothetical protein